jgi:hypothetical protein
VVKLFAVIVNRVLNIHGAFIENDNFGTGFAFGLDASFSVAF